MPVNYRVEFSQLARFCSQTPTLQGRVGGGGREVAVGVGSELFPSPSIACAVSQLGMAQRCGLTRRQGDGCESPCDLPRDLGKVPVYEFSSLFQATSTPPHLQYL